MKNIHVLPTDKASSLIIYNSKLKLVNYPVITPSGNQKHVYITSDEEIKEGDWCIEYDDIDKKWLNLYKPTNKSWDMVSKANYCRLRGTVKKIILTTDQDLIKDGVQAIDDEFLEWFINNSNCEEIKEGDVVKIPCGVGKVKELTWKFGNDNPSYIVEDIFIYKLRYGQKEGELQINSFRYEDVKKIVITTDQDLIDDGVQAIDDEFLEWFSSKNGNVNFVEVIVTEDEKCICENISKEEPKTKCYCGHTTYCDCGVDVDFEIKQETLEEAADKTLQDEINYWYEKTGSLTSEDIVRRAYSLGITTGAKWQEERMYNEEEVLELLNKREDYINSEDNIFEYQDAKKWFEKFKKK